MPEVLETLKLSVTAKPGQLSSLKDLGRDRCSGWGPAFGLWWCWWSTQGKKLSHQSTQQLKMRHEVKLVAGKDFIWETSFSLKHLTDPGCGSTTWWWLISQLWMSIHLPLFFQYEEVFEVKPGGRLSSRSGNLENKAKYIVISLYCSLQHYFLLRISRYLLYQYTHRVKTISDRGFYQNRIQYWKHSMHFEFY